MTRIAARDGMRCRPHSRCSGFMGSVRLLMLAVIMLASAAGSAPAIAQEIKPLDIAKDENGVDLLSGRIQRRSPVVSVPGSARLKFTSLQDLQPYLRGRIYASPDNRTTYEINDGSGNRSFSTAPTMAARSR